MPLPLPVAHVARLEATLRALVDEMRLLRVAPDPAVMDRMARLDSLLRSELAAILGDGLRRELDDLLGPSVPPTSADESRVRMVALEGWLEGLLETTVVVPPPAPVTRAEDR